MLLIVLGHVLRGGFLRQLLFAFSVPLFFLLAGMTYRRERRWTVFVRKRLRSLMLPYFAAALFSIAVFSFLGAAAGARLGVPEVRTGVLRSLLGMLWGNSRSGMMKWNEPLWFLPCLFAASLLCDLWERGIVGLTGAMALPRSRFPVSAGVLCPFLRLVFCLLSFAAAEWYARAGAAALPWSAEAAVGMSGFFEMGILLRSLRAERFHDFDGQAGGGARGRGRAAAPALRTVLPVFVLPAGTAALIVICRRNGFAQVRDLNYGNSALLFYLAALAGCAAALSAAWLLRGVRWLGAVGRDSLFILLFHKLPVVLLQLLPGTAALWRRGSGAAALLAGAAAAAAAIALCMAFHVLLRRSRIAKSRFRL